MRADTPSPQSILDYWIGDIRPEPSYLQERARLWFGGEKSTDREIKTRFEPAVECAGRGALSKWEEDATNCLALSVLLDQFPLNIYRDEAKGYLLSDQALPIALRALKKGLHTQRHPVEKVFFYLPLEHAEDLELQKQAVGLFNDLCKETEGTFWAGWARNSLDYAERHLVVVEKFGRFPHRNAALGRMSTPAELEFLKLGRPF